MRIDQWLWSVRLFRSRTLSSEAIRGGHVKISDAAIKPAHEVRPGMVVKVTQGGICRVFRVTGLPPSRVGARRVPEFLEDLTPPEALAPRPPSPGQRARGAGRPTKRDRRALEEMRGRLPFPDDFGDPEAAPEPEQ